MVLPPGRFLQFKNHPRKETSSNSGPWTFSGALCCWDLISQRFVGGGSGGERAAESERGKGFLPGASEANAGHQAYGSSSPEPSPDGNFSHSPDSFSVFNHACSQDVLPSVPQQLKRRLFPFLSGRLDHRATRPGGSLLTSVVRGATRLGLAEAEHSDSACCHQAHSAEWRMPTASGTFSPRLQAVQSHIVTCFLQGSTLCSCNYSVCSGSSGFAWFWL